MTRQSRAKSKTLLEAEEFDLLIIGGGIFGAVTAWQAVKRGLKVALVEGEDFAHGSSANSYKIIHGGIRYMQHLDIPRILSSSRERSAFMRIAPHLCEPLPIMIPTYGWGKLGKPFLGAGCLLYDIITLRRNFKIKDSGRKIPFTKFVDKKTVLQEYPDLDPQALTGACMFNDGRFYNPTRLVWAFCESAQHEGAAICNYIKADTLVVDEDVVTGVRATDQLTGEEITIRSRCVLNTAGPWAERWLESVTEGKFKAKGVYSRDACFVVDRKSSSQITLAVQGEAADPDAILAREKRHLFLSPWRNVTLVGVWHKVTDVKPEDVTVSNQELDTYIKEINSAYPALKLRREDVRMWNAGLVPFGDEQKSDENLSYGKRSNIIDHEKNDGLKNFVSLIGLRYTMARGEGEKVLDQVQHKLGLQVSKLKTDFLRLTSAGFDDIENFNRELIEKTNKYLPENVCTALVRNYGSFASEIVSLIEKDTNLAQIYDGTTVTAAEVQYVCSHEMVETLADVVFRRTDIATAGNPGDDTLKAVTTQLANLKSWGEDRQRQELEAVMNRFPQV